MSMFLTLAYLFFIGSVFGWVLELFFRHFISSANPERKWINPGFCTGPYLPLYGSGLCILYLTAHIGDIIGVDSIPGKIAIILIMAVFMTVIEYIAGIVSLKATHVRLWDYSDEWGNIQGIICPKFSFFWALCAAGYYLFIHRHILDALAWLSENLAFSFVIGFFFGVFVIDVCSSAHVVSVLKQYAEEKQIVIKYEDLKAQIRSNHERAKEKSHFFFPFKSTHSLSEHLRENQEAWKKRMRRR